MKAAFIASLILMVGIILFIGLLLFEKTDLHFKNPKIDSSAMEISEENDSQISMSNFKYLDSCRKYLLKDFLKEDIFEKNKTDLKANSVSGVIQAGKKLEAFLSQLEEKHRTDGYILVLEGNLVNEWAPEFDRNNTWSYRTSYDRALSVYKLWLKNDINIRKYAIETVITGGGYYGLCPIKNKDSKRFSVQLIPKN